MSRHDGIVDGTVDNKRVILDAILPKFERLFAQFLTRIHESGDKMAQEYALPMAADTLIRSGEINIKVLATHDRWYGMTLKEDADEVRAAFAKMIAEGVYPEKLV